MWTWLKKIFRPWPKKICIEVRDSECNLLDFKIVKIYSWNEVMKIGSAFSQEVLEYYINEDEVYWTYREVR